MEKIHKTVIHLASTIYFLPLTRASTVVLTKYTNVHDTLQMIRAECPAINDVPIMMNNDTVYTCAQYWTSKGKDYVLIGPLKTEHMQNNVTLL